MGLFGKVKRRSRPANRSHRTTRTLRVEPLERRELLSINVVGTDVYLVGTSGRDYAEVEWVETDQSTLAGQWAAQYIDGTYRVRLNGETRWFLEDELSKVIFRGYSGDDQFYNSTLLPTDADGGAGRDTLQGGGGDDLLVGGPGVDRLYGGYGDDELYADHAPSTYCVLALGPAPAAPDYEMVADELVYESYTVRGDLVPVHDYLYGGYGDDTLHGGRYNDRMWGDAGIDKLFGGAGQDRLFGGAGVDTLHGGSDDDLLAGEADADTLFGDDGDDRLFGGDDADTLDGGPGDDTLLGEGGSDGLFGGPGNDHLLGGEGCDTLHGGAGNDGLFGGADAVRDELYGDDPADGWGDDRFLTRTRDALHDLLPSDAKIRFSDGTSPWTDREVYWVDRAFAELQDFAGTTVVLEDTMGTRPIEFFNERPADLVDDAGERVSGLNYKWQDDDGVWHRTIRLQDTSPDAWLHRSQTSLKYTTIHELAHNWDGTDEEQAHPAGFEYWLDFLALHRDSDFSSGSPDFARDYGRTAATEDWATCWEAALGYRFFDYPGTPSPQLEAKLAIVDEFFAQLRPRTDYCLATTSILASLASAAAESGETETPPLRIVIDPLDKLCLDV